MFVGNVCCGKRLHVFTVQFVPDTTDVESSEDIPTIPCLLYEGNFFKMMQNCKVMQLTGHVLFASTFYHLNIQL
jgi:hypothetical protein